ncbi:MAG: hypothetical protein AAF432_09455 [Planctomycetota bacterium]
MNSSLPMFGEFDAIVERVERISIHGDQYFDAVLVLRKQAQPVMVRIAHHLCERSPSQGDEISVTFLMSQVSAVRFVTSA